jgi:hypothetical protein
VIEITHYGLQKSPISKDDDILLRLRFVARVFLKTGDGEILFGALYAGVAGSAKHASEIVADPAFLKANAEEAGMDLADQIGRAIDTKLNGK